LIFLILAGAITTATPAGDQISPLEMIEEFVAASKVNSKQALAYIAPGTVFQLGDFTGPTSPEALVANIALCNRKAVSVQDTTTGQIKVTWECPPRSGRSHARLALEIVFTVGQKITGGEGEFFEFLESSRPNIRNTSPADKPTR
jgi:hypothetical protein